LVIVNEFHTPITYFGLFTDDRKIEGCRIHQTLFQSVSAYSQKKLIAATAKLLLPVLGVLDWDEADISISSGGKMGN
jgi:hypothetical protein